MCFELRKTVSRARSLVPRPVRTRLRRAIHFRFFSFAVFLFMSFSALPRSGRHHPNRAEARYAAPALPTLRRTRSSA